MSEESNQVKWVGIRPASVQAVFQVEPGPWSTVRGGITRTQIIKNASVSNTTVTIHTVTAGKVLHITSAWVIGYEDATKYAQIHVANSGATLQYKLLIVYPTASFAPTATISYPMPLAVPAGYLVQLTTNTDAAEAGFTGWEE